LADVMTHPYESRKLPYLLAAFNDAHRMLQHTVLDAATTHRVRPLLPPCCKMLANSTRQIQAVLGPDVKSFLGLSDTKSR